MGVVDLRLTRPPPPEGSGSGGGGGGGTASPSPKKKKQQQQQYQELTNARELNDDPPPAVPVRRVDVDALKKEKEKKMYGEAGIDAPPKSTVMFADITEEGVNRLRAMLSNFCRKEDGFFIDDINLRQYGIDSGTQVFFVGVAIALT